MANGIYGNSDKYKMLNFGISKQDRIFTVNGRALESVAEQIDLASLKVVSQMDRVVKKVFDMLAFLKGIEYNYWIIMMQLNCSLLKPHLRYCLQFWSPSYRKYITVRKGA